MGSTVRVTVVREMRGYLSWEEIPGEKAEPDSSNRNCFLDDGEPFKGLVKVSMPGPDLCLGESILVLAWWLHF